MRLFTCVRSLLLCGVGQTAAVALLGRFGSDHNGTAMGVDKRVLSAAVLVPELATIYSTGDVTKRKTAGFGFNFQVEYRQSLWGFCPETIVALEDCLVGSCFDNFACTKGCGRTTETDFSTVSW